MRLLVTGASSFVGAHFCRLAVEHGHEVVGLWRNTPLRMDGVQGEQGDVRTYRPVGVDVVVHLAAKVMAEDALAQNRAMMDAVLGWGVPVAYASSTVVHWPRETAYRTSRVQDEARLVGSGLPHVIVRPCAPYGPRLIGHVPAHAESFHRLVEIVRRAPVVPLIGDGAYRRQPVHVDDFNGAILALLERGVSRGAFDAGGAAPLTMRALLEVLARALGRVLRVVPVSTRLAALGARFVPGFDPAMIREFATDDVVDSGPLREASGVVPRGFEVGVRGLVGRRVGPSPSAPSGTGRNGAP